MTATALGHPLSTLRDGVTGFAGDQSQPMPLSAMRVEVTIEAGLAVITTTRTFRNAESEPIEAVLTFPVAFEAVVTGLTAQVDGRTLVAHARPRDEAREVYEGAVERGKLAILHEEALKGVHVLTVGQLGPGASVSVVVETVTPLTLVCDAQLLRIPATVGELYGTSPLLPADDLVTGPGALATATLAAHAARGRLVLDGVGAFAGDVAVPLDRPIVMRLEGGALGERVGRDAFGRAVRLTLAPAPPSDRALDCAVLVDRSGSTGSREGGANTTVWQALREGLDAAFAGLRPQDRIALWQFDSACQLLGEGRGATAAGNLIAKLGLPAGGTELGAAVEAVARSGARDVLVLTDGQTHARESQEAAARGCRVSALLAGDGSLDAGVGHLAALTGGHVAWAPVDGVASLVASLLDGLRDPASAAVGAVEGDCPRHAEAQRAGLAIAAAWFGETRGGVESADAVGRYAAALALPLLPAEAAGPFAAAHGLCTHLTSLVLVDEAGAAQEGLPAMRKVPLASRPGRMAFVDVMPCMAHYAAAPSSAGLREDVIDYPRRRASDIEWARHGRWFAAGDLSALSEVLRRRIARIAAEPATQAFAASLGIDPMLAVIALLALVDSDVDRHARRVADRLLAGADPLVVQMARMQIPLSGFTSASPS